MQSTLFIRGILRQAGLLLLAAVLIAAPAARAQVQNEIPPEAPSIISVDVSLVDVLFTVTNTKGKSVRNLKQEQFRVYEDERPQAITSFTAESNLPLSIALLVDTSGSVFDKLRFEQEAAIQFLQSTVVPQKDRAAVMSFDSRTELLQDYTDRADLLTAAVRKMRAGGGTSFYDAISLTATKKLGGQNGRKILVVVTDGVDTSSRLSVDEAIQSALKNNVIIYAVSTNSPALGGEGNKHGDSILKKLAVETGGKAFYPSKLSDLPSNFAEITDELRFQYTLAYRSSNLHRDGSYRQLRIDPMNKRYVVRTRQGYYAPTSASGN